jgi:hypothetical protein
MKPYIVYINPEEEIMSLVARLKVIPAKDVILVIPQASRFLESLINLQLLERQMEQVGKNIAIATQDIRGSESAKRAGIEVVSMETVFEISEGEYSSNNTPQEVHRKGNMQEKMLSQSAYDIASGEEEEFVSHKNSVEIKKKTSSSQRERVQVVSQNNPIRSQISDGIRRRVSDMNVKQHPPSLGYSRPSTNISEKRVSSIRPPQHSVQPTRGPLQFHEISSQERQKESPVKEIENDYSSRKTITPRRYTMPSSNAEYKEDDKDIPKERGKRKGLSRRGFVFLFLFVGIMTGALVSAVFFWKYIPEADVRVLMKTTENSSDVLVDASQNGLSDIPLEIMEREIVLQDTFSSTGSESGNNKKATGVVTLYNEYSQEDQPLVATTRLLTEDGKLFRITESVIIPGYTKEGESVIPGEVSVSVKADEAGESFNIEPTRFTIPGFEGSEKYENFYAISEEAFVGGGDDEKSVRVVSLQDIENAQEKIESNIREEAKRIFQEGLDEQWIVLDETLTIEIRASDAFPQEGTVAETFEYTVTAFVRAMATREDTIRNFASQKLRERISQKNEGASWNVKHIDVQYGKVDANFEDQKLSLKLYATAQWMAGLETEEFKKNILGKNIQEIQEILDEYSYIEQINIDIRPSLFFTRIPVVESRVYISVGSNEEELQTKEKE